MNQEQEAPTLRFFLAVPPGLTEHPPLASSLQSFETCLLLIAFHSLPNALISCATAWESAMKAHLGIGQDDRIDWWGLLQRIGGKVRFSDVALNEVRATRNRLVHYGYSPRDDDVCAALLLETGLPYLSLLYRKLFNIYLDWRDIRPGLADFSQLTPEEKDKAGLFQELADHIHLAYEVHNRVKQGREKPGAYCLSALAHFVRVLAKKVIQTEAEDEILEDPNSTKWLAEQKIKEHLERVFDAPWVFDCPVCDYPESFVADLKNDRLDVGQVVPERGVCASCGFRVPLETPHLLEVLLSAQVMESRQRILTEFGIGH